MERRLREEDVTKAVISWLKNKDWKIICYDFPQSGTGKILHSNNHQGTKNKDSIIPDIVAIKRNSVVFFEDKDRFVLSDFKKIEKIKLENNYSDSIKKLLLPYKYKKIFYGIGLPVTIKNKANIFKNRIKVDFIIDSDGNTVNINYQNKKIF
jgi:hypothetical protein